MRPLSVHDETCVKIASIGQNLDLIRLLLKQAGYCSKSGLELTESHVSNFRRKDLGIRSAPYYSKPNYQGRNWITG